MPLPDDTPERASRPAFMLDAIPIGVQLDAWRDMAAPDDPRLPEATLRLGELIRPFDPERAADLAVAAFDAGADRERCTALSAQAQMEQGRTKAVARFAATMPPGPRRELVEARLALLESRLDEGLARLDALLTRPELPPEVEAEALSFRARARPEAGLDAIIEDLDALEALCLRHDATLTGVWVGMLKGLLRSEGRRALADALSTADLGRLLISATADLDPIDPATLGPIPLHVHGALKRFRTDPDQLVEHLILIAALQWRLGQHEAAYRGITLGARLARPIVGPGPAAALEQFRGVLRGQAEEGEWETLERALAEDEAKFLSESR
ncbi:MAG: hypothetical protein H6741_06315 [Alphaproteobacteria bacterium]|nr:hypothetical protein [Alphaproteobacteria bacterium]MCB9792324.1 hypothetical protein [Alphaproteobacteria bacterium]